MKRKYFFKGTGIKIIKKFVWFVLKMWLIFKGFESFADIVLPTFMFIKKVWKFFFLSILENERKCF